MQNLIKVRTPLTSDGNMPVIGTDGRQVYTESILTSIARPILEKRNQTLPTPLKVLIEDYAGEVAVVADNEEPAIKQPTGKTNVKNVTNATA